MEPIANFWQRPLERMFFRRLIDYSTRLLWLIADQGVFASASFIVNILFARWLLPVDYGMFAVAFSGYLLLTVFHFGAILEPLLVQSNRVEAYRLRAYIVTLIKAHVILIAAMSMLAGLGLGVACLLGAPMFGWAILAVSIGGSFMVTLLTARRLCLVFLSPRVSACIGILYMVGVVTTTYLVHAAGPVSWFDLWLIMGGWSLLGSAAIFLLLYGTLGGSTSYSLGELCRFQWHYARYGLAASVCSWVRFDGVLLLLAHFAGLEAIAETRAMLNVGSPIVQVHLALHSSWLVEFGRDRRRATLWKTVIVYCIALGLMVVVMFVIARPLMQLVYSGRYLHGIWLLPLYVLSQAFHVIESIFSCHLKAGGLLWRGYAPQFIGCAVSLLLGLLLIPSMSEAGFIYAIIISFAVGATVACSLTQIRT
jgi:O-antigen/teichoic acid export membrane protein